MNPLLAKAEALKALVIGALLLTAVIAIYQFGRHVKTGEVAAENLQAARALATQVQALQDKADLLTTANTLLRGQKTPKDRLITKEITRYADLTPSDQRCTLPGTWRVRHDAAATGIPLDAETGSVAFGTGGEVEDAAALEIVAENYAAARECADKLDGWIRRYRTVERPDPAP